jgi:hypothetical protein
MTAKYVRKRFMSPRSDGINFLVEMHAAFGCLDGITDDDDKRMKEVCLGYLVKERVYETPLTMVQVHDAFIDMMQIVMERLANKAAKAEMAADADPSREG